MLTARLTVDRPRGENGMGRMGGLCAMDMNGTDAGMDMSGMKMGGMNMAGPKNAPPMMTGDGPFGNIEMGGMFTTVKIRKDQKPGDYKDPGWYKHPAGTVAYEWKGDMPPAPKAPAVNSSTPAVELKVRKPPGGHKRGRTP